MVRLRQGGIGGQHVHEAHDVDPEASSDKFFLRLDRYPSLADLFGHVFQQRIVDHKTELPAEQVVAGFFRIIEDGFVRGAGIEAAEPDRVRGQQPMRFLEGGGRADVHGHQEFFIEEF